MIYKHLKTYFRFLKIARKLKQGEIYKILLDHRNSVEDSMRLCLKEIERTQPTKFRKALFKSVRSKAEDYTPQAMNLARLNTSKIEIDNAIYEYKQIYLSNNVKQRALTYGNDFPDFLKLNFSFTTIMLILAYTAHQNLDELIIFTIVSAVAIYLFQMKSNRTICEIKNAIIDTNKQH